MSRKKSIPSSNTPMEAFFTEEKASIGVKVPLRDANGFETEHWLVIRGADSEEFRLEEAASRRKAIEISGLEDATERDKAAMLLSRDLAASLVIDWSFPQECTRENVKAFFQKAPQIQRAVDIAATNRVLFSNVESANSTSTPNTNSAST